MTSSSPAAFVARSLQRHGEVTNAAALNDFSVQVSRKTHPNFVVGAVSSKLVKSETIRPLVDSGCDFIVNIPKEAAWSGEAIGLSEAHGIGWGSIGDLFSASSSEIVRGFVKKEFLFVERIFHQHSAVLDFERIFDRVYKLQRNSKPAVTVALINEYDMTADAVRTAWQRYGPFTDILANNPNCRFSPEAQEAAKDLGVIMLPLREFMGRLNT